MGMEVLSALIRRDVEGGYIFGCRIRRGRGQASISHLLFADDAIVFCEAKKDDMTYLSWILCWFEVVSGLRINLAKSEIIPVGEVDEILEMAVELGCKVGQLPSTYLGLPWVCPINPLCVGWDGRKDEVEISPLETAIHLQGWSQRITLEEDLALWKGGKNGKFGVKEAYGLMISHSVPLFPKKGIWVENVPSKLAFFAWEATWGRVVIPVASVLWGIVLSLFGAQWIFTETVKEGFSAGRVLFLKFSRLLRRHGLQLGTRRNYSIQDVVEQTREYPLLGKYVGYKVALLLFIAAIARPSGIRQKDMMPKNLHDMTLRPNWNLELSEDDNTRAFVHELMLSSFDGVLCSSTVGRIEL
ncbi:hypothetical protein CK203_034501 [Vitis vinifera]|uniref:Reverse transcriptase zinc-binding domain-containing protein n=1 Tax=Vitis vinifera TaxID=29760 RepID=A0A438IE15_VITVI|nr:hypothetical protein CK203_034501 [Vitis vinifera]